MALRGQIGGIERGRPVLNAHSLARIALYASLALGCQIIPQSEAQNAPQGLKFEISGQLNNEEFNSIVDSIYIIEGGEKSKKPFGILSIPCDSYAMCRKVCYNTVENNFYRWAASGRLNNYLEFLGARYAPIGAENDPGNLNQNWIKNLKGVLNERKFPMQKLQAIR